MRVKQFRDDLLASCLQLLLSMPRELVECEGMIESLVPALQVGPPAARSDSLLRTPPSPPQMAFKVGLSYLPLARASLAALEAWSSQLTVKRLEPLLVAVLPCLDPYLKTAGGGVLPVTALKAVGLLHADCCCCYCCCCYPQTNRVMMLGQ